MWVHGPFPCGRYNNIMIFRHCLSGFLDRGERVECDDGYRGEVPEQCVVTKICMDTSISMGKTKWFGS